MGSKTMQRSPAFPPVLTSYKLLEIERSVLRCYKPLEIERMGCEPYYRPAGAALKQVGMGTSPDKPHCLVCDVVDQQPIWLYMAVPIGLPVSCQGMRAVSCCERFPHLQFLHHGL